MVLNIFYRVKKMNGYSLGVLRVSDRYISAWRVTRRNIANALVGFHTGVQNPKEWLRAIKKLL